MDWIGWFGRHSACMEVQVLHVRFCIFAVKGDGMDYYQRWKYRKRKEREEYNRDRQDNFGTDYYERLGLNRDATPEQIDSAWRIVASNILSSSGNTISALRLTHEAYRVLINPTLRKKYDLYLQGDHQHPTRFDDLRTPVGSHYQKLEVDVYATSSELKSAWRKAAKKWHPDVCGRSDATDVLRDLNEAYIVLSCPIQRGRYDREIGIV